MFYGSLFATSAELRDATQGSWTCERDVCERAGGGTWCNFQAPTLFFPTSGSDAVVAPSSSEQTRSKARLCGFTYNVRHHHVLTQPISKSKSVE